MAGLILPFVRPSAEERPGASLGRKPATRALDTLPTGALTIS